MNISELQINNESMRLIVLGLAAEVHEFARSRGIASHSVEDQLPLVFGVIDRHRGDLLDIREVATGDTPCLAGISIRFSDEGYRLAAQTAKDRVADAVDRD